MHVYEKYSAHVRSARGCANEYEYDRFAVAVVNDGEVSRTLNKVTSFFLRYDGNFVFCEVTGERLNSGVQVPCVHKYYGHQTHIDKFKELVVNVEQ